MDNNSSWINWTPEFYSRLSPSYDKLAPIFFAIGERAKLRVAEELESGSILDIACGTGSLLALAQDKGLKCFGIDNSQGMVAESRKKIPEAEIKQASFYQIPYPENTFDYVVETNTVSGIEINADEVIAEMIRVCKPGGKVLIGDYCKAPEEGLWTKIMEWIGKRIGDHPHNFSTIFRNLGFESQVEIMGWSGMYQFISVEIT